MSATHYQVIVLLVYPCNVAVRRVDFSETLGVVMEADKPQSG